MTADELRAAERLIDIGIAAGVTTLPELRRFISALIIELAASRRAAG